MANIIIVEDNDSIRESVKSYLELENYTVYEFNKSQGVYEALEHKTIDLLILDVMLPDESGFALAKKLRMKKVNIPIIFLTARTAESDKITGFEIGADDYVVKPFSPRELVLRVKALLKRAKQNNNEDKKNLKFKNGAEILSIDIDMHKVNLNDSEIYLTSSEWEILKYLTLNPGTVISREKILGESLDYLYEGSERTVDTHVKNLRAKLGGSPWIETVRNYGYKFTGEKA